METLDAAGESSSGKRVKVSLKAAKEGDSSLLRLPVEVHRRILSFLNYDHQLSLLHCSSSLRRAACKAMTRAGFAGPIPRLTDMLPEVRKLALSPQGAFRVSDLKDVQLQSLLLELFHECAFTMEVGDSIDEDAPIKQLEYFCAEFKEPSGDGSKALGDAVAQVLRCLMPLPRLQWLRLKCTPPWSPQVLSTPVTWSVIEPILLSPVGPPGSSSTSSVPAPPSSPFPTLLYLDLDLTQRDFFELLSALEDPAVLPALQEVDLGISEDVRFVQALEALASRPTEEGSRLLRCRRVKIDPSYCTNALGEVVPDCWIPGGSLVYRQASVLLDYIYMRTDPERKFQGMVDLLQHPGRTIPRRYVLDRLLVATGRTPEGPMPEYVQVITDAILAELTTATEHRQKERKDDMLAVLAVLAGLPVDDDWCAHPSMWAELSSRPDFIHALVSLLRQPGKQAQDAMAILRELPAEPVCFSYVASLSGATDGGLADLLGLIDFMRYREWEFSDPGCVQSNRRVVASLLSAVSKPVALEAVTLRFLALLTECLHGLAMWPREGEDHSTVSSMHDDTSILPPPPSDLPLRQLLALLEEVDGAWPKIKQVILAHGKMALARLAYGLSDMVLEELVADEHMLHLAKEMMDAAIEETWTRGRVSFEVCRALWRLIPLESFRQWLLAHYTEVEITAVLLSCRPEYYPLSFSALHLLVCGRDESKESRNTKIMDALLRCAMSTHPSSHEGGHGKGPRAELVVRSLAMGICAIALPGGGRMTHPRLVPSRLYEFLLWQLLWKEQKSVTEQRDHFVSSGLQGDGPPPCPSPQALVRTEAGQSLLRLLMAYASDRPTDGSKRLIAVRRGVARCMVGAFQPLSSPVDATPLHEPFATLTVESYHNYCTEGSNTLGIDSGLGRLADVNEFAVGLELLGEVTSDVEDLARCLWKLRSQYALAFWRLEEALTEAGAPTSRLLRELQALRAAENAEPNTGSSDVGKGKPSASTEDGGDGGGGAGGGDEDDEDGGGGSGGGDEDGEGDGEGEDEEDVLAGDGEDDDSSSASASSDEEGDSEAERLLAYHERKKEPWARALAANLWSTEERGSIIVEREHDDFDAEVQRVEDQGTVSEDEIWKYTPGESVITG